MNDLKRSKLLMWSLVILIALWFIADGYVNYKYGLHSTLSWLLYTSAFERPVIPYLFGFFSGLIGAHLYWGAGDSKP